MSVCGDGLLPVVLKITGPYSSVCGRCTLGIPEILGSLRQEDYKFETILGCLPREIL